MENNITKLTKREIGEKVMQEQLPISVVHFEEEPIFGEKRRQAEGLNRKLKAVTTDEIHSKYKLANKSLGHRYLILLGLNKIETPLESKKTK